MLSKAQLVTRKNRGFTILETLIVISIASLMLLIVFMAVPALQRNQRNADMKTMMNFTATAMEEYALTNESLIYPDQGAKMCTFINNYLKQRAGTVVTPCVTSYSTDAAFCVKAKFSKYSFCYRDKNNSGHDYFPPPGEIAIELGHWCTPNPNTTGLDDGNPITSGNDSAHLLFRRYAIWASMEPNGMHCIDNFPSDR